MRKTYDMIKAIGALVLIVCIGVPWLLVSIIWQALWETLGPKKV